MTADNQWTLLSLVEIGCHFASEECLMLDVVQQQGIMMAGSGSHVQ